MKTNTEKNWSVFARLGLTLLSAIGAGLLFAITVFYVALWIAPAAHRLSNGVMEPEWPVAQAVIAAAAGIVSGLAVLILMTRTFVLRTGTITD